MSLKAEWDPAGVGLIEKCEVIAAWMGFRLRRAGRKWKVVPWDQPNAPVAKGLSLAEVDAWLSRGAA